MLNGFTSQLTPTVTAMPRHCSATRCSAPKSTLSSIGAALQGQAIELVDRRCGEKLNARFELPAGVAKRLSAVLFAALDGGRVGNAPMRGDRIARPKRANFAGGLVADGEDKIHPGCV